jgi:hypothetical protein
MTTLSQVVFDFETFEQLEVFDFPIPFESGSRTVRLCVAAKGSGGGRPSFFRCSIMPSHICDHVELTDKKAYFDLPVLMVQDYIRMHREGASTRKISEDASKASIDVSEQLPDKIYLQIDGASDNTIDSIFATLEDSIGGAGLSPINEVQHLPEGHTHEGIDARFEVVFDAC